MWGGEGEVFNGGHGWLYLFAWDGTPMQRMIHSCTGGGSRKQPQAASSKQPSNPSVPRCSLATNCHKKTKIFVSQQQ